MTWVDKLFEKKIKVGKLSEATKLPAGYYVGKVGGLDEIDLIGFGDLVSVVLEERNRIEEVVLKEPVCARGSIRHHEHARSFKSLLEKCEASSKGTDSK